MKNKILRRTIAIVMTLGMLLGSVSGHVTPVFATGEEGDTVVTEVSQEATQAPTEPEVTTVVETEAPTEETTTVETPTEEPTPEVTTEAPAEEPTPEETTEAPVTEETTAAPTTEETTAAPTTEETTTAPEETKEKTVKELTWDGGTVKITVSRKDGAEIPESSTLKVETLDSMNQSKSEEEELSIIKSFYDPAIDKIADEYGLDKESEAYKALVAGLLPFAVSIKDKDGKENVPEMNVKIELKDSANEMYDLVNNKQIREIRIAEFDSYKNATLLKGDKASVSFDTAKGTYTAAAKTSSTGKYVVILYIDNDKVKEAQPKAPEQKDDSEEETDGEDADPDSEVKAEEETTAPEEETSAEEETPKETPAEKDEVVIKSNRLLGGRGFLMESGPLKAGGSGEASEIGQYAASIYGDPDSENYKSQIIASILSEPSGTFHAGDTVQYAVTCLFRTPETKKVSGYDKAYSLFDIYEESTVTVSLPAGLLLTGLGDSYDIVSIPNDNDPNKAHKYVITLDPRPAKVEPLDFTLSVYICNNGTDKAVETFNFTDMVEFNTSFWVLDKNYQADDPNADYYDNNKPGNYYVHQYFQTSKANPVNSLTTVTPDEWGIEKSLESASLSEDEQTVTFKWKVDVGLLRADAEGNKKVVKDKADPIYKQNGRDALESISISDTFLTKLFKKAETEQEVGTDVPDSLLASLTIEKDGGTPTTYIKGSEVPLFGDLALDTTTVEINRTPDFITDEDGQWVGNNQTTTVPIWTTYYVTATYNVTSDMIADFSENIKYRLKSDNDAKLEKYKLADVDERTGNTDSADGTVQLPITDPATLIINKELKSVTTGKTEPYAGEHGTIEYTLSSATPFTVYSYDSATGTYSPIEGKVNVTSTTVSAETTYYLASGIQYTVAENLSDAQKLKMALDSEENTTKTPSEKEAWTAKITNREYDGKITISKVDDVQQPVRGAEFTLYYKNEDETETKVEISGLDNPTTTVATGYAEFTRLPYGNYVLKETSVPDGYSMGTTTSWDITISAANPVYSFGAAATDDAAAIVNNSNIGRFQLTKYVGIAEAQDNMSKANTGFGTFTLYRRLKNVANAQWEAVTKDIYGEDIPTSVMNANGLIYADLPIADARGNQYEYKFVETIPSGYYDPATGKTDTAESAAKTLVKKQIDNSGNVTNATNVDMYNRKFVNIQINKEFKDVNASGTIVDADNKTTRVALYSYTGTKPASEDGLTLVKEGTAESQEVGKNASGTALSANWTNLPVYDGTDKIHYLVKEEAVAGYALTNSTVTVGTTDYVEIVTSGGTNDAYSTTLANYQQVVPVKIWKENYYTQDHNITGSAVTIYTDTDLASSHIAKDGRDKTTALSGVSIPGADPQLYAVVYLTPGSKYYIKETTMPSSLPHLYGYTADTADGKTSIKTEYGIIDLSSISTVSGDVTVKNYYVYNYKDPVIRVNKKDSVSNSNVSGTGLKFEVYVKDGSTYKKYEKPAGTPVVINTVNADSSVELPKGEYYFHEVGTPDGYLNPDVQAFYNLYYAADNDRYVRATVDGQTITLAKVNVTNMTKNGNNANKCTFDFINIPNKGKLRVTKYVDGTVASAAQTGFTIRVTGNDSPATTKAGTTGTTSTDPSVVTTASTVTFEVPVYNADGTKITYTITEDELTEALAKDYYKFFDGQTVQLDLYKTSADIKTKDAAGKTLQVENKTKINLNVEKLRRYTWQYNSGVAMDFPLPGATIALYRKAPGETTWTKVTTAVSDENGFAKFDKVERGYDYVAVEVSCTNDKLYPITEAGTPKQYLSTAPDTIDDLSAYNYVQVSADDLKDVKGDYKIGTLYNADHWVQFHVTKYLDTKNPDKNQLDISNPYNAQTDDQLLNHVVFSLYRYILPAGADSVNFNSENPLGTETDPSGWVRIGTYTSGTFYDVNGNRMDGQLLTAADGEVDDNYVYLLVEDNTGANGGSVVIMPEYQYTFWYSENHADVTCNVDGSAVGRSFEYEMDKVNHTDVLNDTPSSPGEADILIASFRLAKWRIEYKDDGTLEDGYFPLSNATFELRLANSGDVIAHLVSGKDGSNKYAVDQSGTFTLAISSTDGVTKYALHDFEAEDKDVKTWDAEGNPTSYYDYKSYDVTDITEVETTSEGWTLYKIRVNLFETSAPRGYGFPSMAYETYLIFLNKNVDGAQHYWYSNDLYYVLSNSDNDNIKPAKDQDSRYWYVTNMDDEKTAGAANIEHLGTMPQRRIIDYPMNNAMVTVHKFGYKPSLATRDESSLDLYLNDSVNKTPLAGVTMVLERLDSAGDGKYHPWNDKIDGWNKNSTGSYVEYTFTIDQYGRYEFEKGLPAGTYRIYEKDMKTTTVDWGKTYENAYPLTSKDTANDRARVFTIGEGVAGMDVYMANPEKFDLTLEKQDMAGATISGAKFTLTPTTGSAIAKDTGTDGSVTFDNLASGTYKLTETVSGYTNSYLTKYFTSNYSSLVDLVNGTGAFIGYTYDTEKSTTGTTVTDQDVVVHTIAPTRTTGSGETAAEELLVKLTIKNPKNGSIKLIKHGESDQTSLRNAKFQVYYHAFDDCKDTAFTMAAEPLTSDNYGSGKYWGTSGGGNYTTGNDGTVTINDRWAGIYAIVETEAPSTHEILKDSSGKDIVYYVVLTGGIPVTVTGLPTEATVKYDITRTVDGQPVKSKKVTTLFTGDGSATVDVELFNLEKVRLTAKKLINYGGAEVNKKTDWSVNLNIYTTATGGSPVAYARLNNNNSEHYFTTNNSATSANYYYFSKDTTYYVEEVINSYKYAFALSKLKINGTEVTITPGTRYPVDVGDQGFTIEATNDWLWGEVTFQKVDADNVQHPLPGATFEVQAWQVDTAHPDGAWLNLANSKVEPVKDADGNDTGRYKATIPLQSAAETEYRIVEKDAPENYFKDASQYISVRLSLQNNVKDISSSVDVTNHECISNRQGYPIEITKYNNVHSATKNVDHVSTGDATFKIYHQKADGTWEEVSDTATDENGQVTYLANPNDRYAVAEYKYNPAKFIGMDGIYSGSEATDPILPIVPEADLNGLVVTDEARNAVPLYDLGRINSAVSVYAYNIPFVKRTIAKVDVGGYATNIRAMMDFNIYEIGSDFVATDETVNAFLKADPAPVAVFDENQKTNGGNYGARGTKYEWGNINTPAKCWDPTKRYIVIETNVAKASGSGRYDTMNKSDPDVTWFKVIEPETDLNPNTEYTTVLENIYSDATVILKKQIVDGQNADGSDKLVDKKSVDSLLEGKQDVVYVLAPTVTSHNQPLAGFKLTDKGLTFNPADDAPDYNITKVIIGKASHDPSKFGFTNETAPISATIEFYDGYNLTGNKLAVDSDGNTSKTVDVSGGDQEVAAPEGTKSFNISYSSEKVSNYFSDTTEQADDTIKIYYKDQPFLEYVLGEEFKAYPTKVYVTVDQQADGDKTNAIKEVKDFTNDAVATLSYSQWRANGNGVQKNTTYGNDSAKITVNSIKLPVVDVVKTSAPDSNIKIGGVDVTTITYTIEVKNTGNPAVDFIDPLVLDLLPTGVTYIDGSATVLPGEGGTVEFGLDITPKTGEATMVVHKGDGTYDIGDQETALVFQLHGTLKPGKSVKIKFTGQVKDSVMMYGNIVENDVFLSSSHRSYYTESNPHGYAFCTENNESDPRYKFPETLANQAAILDNTNPASGHATRKEGGMDDALKTVNGEDLTSDDYVWVSAKKQVTVTTQSNLTLVKAVKGDQDEAHGFDDTDAWLGTATRTNSTPGKETNGWVDYRLTIENGGVFTDNPTTPDRYERHNLVIGDVVPKYNVTEDTNWDVIMDGVTSVMIDSVEKNPGANGYYLYYYTGNGDPFTALEGAYADNINWTGASATAWPITGNSPREGWRLASEVEAEAAAITDAAEKDAFMANIKAFCIVFDSTVTLKGGQTIVVTLHTKVKDIPLDADFVSKAFTNATNRFYLNYQGAPEILPSNPVSVTLLDKPIAVEGDLWIDEDWDSTQEVGSDDGTFYPNANGNRRDYSQYAIIQKLLNKTYFGLIDNRKAASHTETEPTYTPKVPAAKVGYGESIKHFRFDELGGANPNGNELYPGNKLSINGLMTRDPFNYTVRFHITDTSLLNIFRRSTASDIAYISDNADNKLDSTGNPLPYILDDNFHGEGGVYETDPFFLRYTVETDRTKDIGLQMVRELELTKLAADDSETVVAGAKFQVFGPFEDTSLTGVSDHTPASGSALKFTKVSDGVYALDPAGTVDTLVTDANGKIKITGLNWWKEYDIKEIEAAPGYDVANAVATADASAGTQIKDRGNGVFTLKVPSTTKVDPTDKVTVKDPRGVEIQLDVEKIVNTYSEEEFTFNFSYWLTSVTPDTTAALNTSIKNTEADPIQTMQIKAKGNKTTGTGYGLGSFDKIKVFGAGTYVFTIKEKVDQSSVPSGWTYDTAKKTATVVVEWSDADQKLVVKSITYSDPDTKDGKTYEKFTNKYAKTGEWTPEANKSLTGRPIVAEEFTFTVKEGSKDVSTGKVNADGTITFTKIEYDLADIGTHTYIITEDAGSAAGMTYSNESITVIVVVADNASSDKLTVTATYPEDTTFNNTWNATGEWTPKVFKVLEGRDFNEGEKFEVTVTDASGAVKMTGEVTTGRNGRPTAFSFSPEKITYTQADVVNFAPTTFTYTIREKVPTQNPSNGVTFSVDVYTVDVTIALHQNADGTYSDKLDVTDNAPKDGYTFKNTYQPASVAAQPKATKSMRGERTVEDLTFDFTLTAKTVVEKGAFQPADAADAIAAGKTWTKSVTVPAGTTATSPALNVLFDEITYKKAGTYVYEIAETVGTNSNVTYDGAKWTYTVVVTDNTATGKLEVAETYLSDASGSTAQTTPAAFVNEYEPTPTAIPLWVEKILTGEPLHDAANTYFEFNLAFEKATVTGGYKLPDATSIRISGTDVEAGGENAKAKFGDIEFTKAGTYDFLISETRGTLSKVYYDETVWRATVTVVDYPPQGTYPGGLAATVVYTNIKTGTPYSWALFTNDYNPEDVTYIPGVKKIITGEPRPENKETFNFTLELISQVDTKGKPITENGVTIPAGGDKTSVTDEGTSYFGQLTFHKKGTYTFKITELAGGNEHYKYDEHTWTLVVVVKDNADGNLILDPADPVYTRDDSTTNDHAEFTNHYTPDPVKWYPSAKKLMTGEPTAVNKEFTFTITQKSGPAGGAELPSAATVTVTVPAGATESLVKAFNAITFKKAGTYVFEVTENSGTLPGIEYSTEKATFTVEIVDNKNQLEVKSVKAEGSVDQDGNAVTAKFTNNYKVTPTTYTPPVVKELTTNYGPTVADKTFNFEMVLVSAENTVNGTKINVESGSSVQKTPAATAQVVVEKGKVTGTTNFEPITFTKAGTYVFKVTETATNEAGITYDTTEWTLTVVVGDHDGQLRVDSTSNTHDEVTADRITFNNEYKPQPVDWAPMAKKLMTGEPTVADKSFTFRLTADSENPEDGAALPADTTVTVTVPAETTESPVGTFGNINFTKAGTYVFYAEEVAGSLAGIGYTDAKVKFTVTVTDKDGRLEVTDVAAEGDADKDGIAVTAKYTNSYSVVPTEYVPPVEKDLTVDFGPTVADKIFNFEMVLVSAENTVNGTKINVEAGSSVQKSPAATAQVVVEAGKVTNSTAFDKIVFTKAGTYIYKITEKAEDEEGITYSTKSWNLTVVVEDTDNKLVVKSHVNSDENNEEAEIISFNNEYKPEPVAYQPEVTKTVTGEPTVKDKEFTFTLKLTSQVDRAGVAITDGAKLGGGNDAWEDQEVKLTVPAGYSFTDHEDEIKAVFSEITFVKAGTYTFDVAETKEALPGITYDETVYTLTVEIVDLDGKLSVDSHVYEMAADDTSDDSAEAPDEDAEAEVETEAARFTNPYDVVPTEYVLPIEKDLKVDFGPTVAEKIFNFTLKLVSAENVVKSEGKEDVTIDVTAGSSVDKETGAAAQIIVEKGKVKAETNFDPITFAKAGTYVYELRETAESEEGVTYDTSVWTLTVVVVDTDNKLSIDEADGGSVNLIKNPAEGEETTEEPESQEKATFENEYKPEPVEWIPQVEKLISEDSNETKVDRSFDFEFKRVIKAADAADEAGAADAADAEEPAEAPEGTDGLAAVQTVEPSDGCWLVYDSTAETGTTPMDDKTTLYAQATVKATKGTEPVADKGWSSGPSGFFTDKADAGAEEPAGTPVTLTFDKAGTYYFTVQEIMPETIEELYPGFTYDVEEKEVEVTIRDIDGELIVESVKIDGEEVYKAEVTETTTDGRTTFAVEYPEDGELPVVTTVPVTNTYYLGKLEITKNLINKEDVNEALQPDAQGNNSWRVLDPATFVFSVEATWSYPGYDGSVKVYSNVVSMVFNADGSETITIEDLPVGAEVTVKEIYTGGNYTLISDETVTVTVVRDDPLTEAEEKAQANFDNAHNGGWKDGGSVTNTIGSDGTLESATYADGRTSTPGGGEPATPEE